MKHSQLYETLFKEKYRKETYKFEAHSFIQNSRIGKPVCSSCGLIALNNSFTRFSIDKGCLSELHPSYEKERVKTGFKNV
jgi:hypothetical protein